MYFEEICIFFRQLIFLIQYYKPKVKRLIQLWWSLIDVKPAPIFSFFENKIISVHISIVSGCDPWGWIRLLLICCFAFCFGWVLSLFTPHQVWHLMELCELIQHTLTRQCSERQKWGVLLSEVTVIIQVVRITVLPREKEKLWKWRESGVRCPVAVISWLSQWSWWTLSWDTVCFLFLAESAEHQSDSTPWQLSFSYQCGLLTLLVQGYKKIEP